MKRAVVLGCAAMLLLSACSRDEQEPLTSPTPTVAASPTPEPTPCVLEGATSEEKSSENQPPISPMIEVRHDDENGCPRVVFEFDGQVSGYRIGYAEEPLTECGSGDEVDTQTWDAGAFLSVRLEPSGGPDMSNDRGEPTYEGARDIAVDGEVLKHLKVICDFEAVFEWVIALDEQHPFNVVTFDDPPRLVVDISQG